MAKVREQEPASPNVLALLKTLLVSHRSHPVGSQPVTWPTQRGRRRVLLTTLYGRGHAYKEARRVGAVFVIHFTWLLENHCIWALNCPPLCLLGTTMHLILMRCWKRNHPASVPEHLSFLCVLWRDGWRVLRLKHAGCPRGSTHVDNWNEGGDRFLYDTNHAPSDQKPQSRSLFSLSV